MIRFQPLQRLIRELPPGRLARIEARRNELPLEMALHELRRAMLSRRPGLQQQLQALQPDIKRLEHRCDTAVSTLRKLVEAMGGVLEVTAHFPDADIIVSNYRSDGASVSSAKGPGPRAPR